MSYKLEKPYKEQEKNNFIVKYNHNKGLEIKETELALFALENNEIIQDGEPIIDPDFAEKQAKMEQERIAMLSLTAADVERGLYKALGKDFDDIITELETLKQCKANQNEETLKQVQSDKSILSEPVCEAVQGDSFNVDIKALKIELKANNFYRGNPYVSQMGALLGLTEKQLDEFFETNDYTKLIKGE